MGKPLSLYNDKEHTDLYATVLVNVEPQYTINMAVGETINIASIDEGLSTSFNWAANNDSIATISGRDITAILPGSTIVKCEYDETGYAIRVNVVEAFGTMPFTLPEVVRGENYYETIDRMKAAGYVEYRLATSSLTDVDDVLTYAPYGSCTSLTFYYEKPLYHDPELSHAIIETGLESDNAYKTLLSCVPAVFNIQGNVIGFSDPETGNLWRAASSNDYSSLICY